MATKQQYLIEENNQLKDQVESLQLQLKLNKQALQIAMQNNPQQESNNSIFNQQNTMNSANINNISQNTSTNQQNDPSKQIQALNKVIKSLYEDNNNQVNNIQRLTEERDIAQGKSLVNEQMFEEIQRQKQELQEDLNGEINMYKYKIQELEKEVHRLEKEKPVYDQISGVVVKYREVVNLNQQSILMHEEQEKLNYIIVKQAKEISKLKRTEDDLTKINVQISQELVKQKAMSYLPGNQFQQQQTSQQFNINQYQQQQQMRRGQQFQNQQQQGIQLNLGGLSQQINQELQVEDKQNQKFNINLNKQTQQTINTQQNDTENNLDKSAMLLMNLHKKIMDGGQSESSEDDYEELEKQCLSPLMSPLPDKVQTQQTQMTQGPPPAIKALDLTRAFQIQDMNAKRSTMIQLEKEQKKDKDQQILYLQDKIKKQEFSLNESRKNLAREMLINKTLMLENEEIKKVVQDLESKNEILINSNTLYEQKWRDTFHAFQFYKEFYKSQKDNANNNDISPLNKQNYKDICPEKEIRLRKKRDREMDRSIMDPNLNPFEDIQQKQQFQMQNALDGNHGQNQIETFGKQQAKDYLMGIAADLYNQMNYIDSNNLQKTTTTTRRLYRRSNSNPIDYIPGQEDVHKQQAAAPKNNQIQNNNKNAINKSSLPYNQYAPTIGGQQTVKDIEDLDHDPEIRDLSFDK